MTDEGGTIRGETAQHGRREKPGRDEAGALKLNDKVGTSAFKGQDKDGKKCVLC